jgi:hypothetical protein
MVDNKKSRTAIVREVLSEVLGEVLGNTLASLGSVCYIGLPCSECHMNM